MGFTDDDIRASHTIRIFGTNSDGEVLQDIWLDIERVDVIRITTKILGRWQGIYRRLYWLDDPASNDYSEDGNPARSEGTKKICSPDEEDPEDPAEWVPVRTIIEMSWNESTDYNQLKARRGNRTDAENLVRLVEARRCFHRDTTIDSDVEAAISGDSGLKAYVVASDEYDFAEDSEDRDQFIEVQYVSCTLDLSSNKEDEGKNQGVQFSMKNVHYLNFTEEAEGPANENHGFDPPWALDPFQAIVNVQWSPVQEAVLGIASPPHDKEGSTTETSADGLTWEDGFGVSSNAASGLGRTVVCKGPKYIAFGKPRDGAACFIAAGGDTIERGILNSSGELEWTAVGSLPGVGATSCSFAGGAFFVSYLGDDSFTASHLSVSFDGEAFTNGINPFNGVVAAANGTGMDPGEDDPTPVGGSVAYDKENKVYVTTGQYERSYWNQQDIGAGETTPTQFVDINFMSSVSSNGTSWTAKFDTSECSGFPPAASAGIGGNNASNTNVTFGNGLFVAAASVKVNYPAFSSESFSPFKLTAYIASVATSPDGVSWTNTQLPEAISFPYAYGYVGGGGTGIAAKFVKTKKNASGVPGFFVATALEYASDDFGLQTKIWQSMDGVNWTLVRNDVGEHAWLLSVINKSRGTVVTRD